MNTRRYLEGLRWETELPPKISPWARLKDMAGLFIVLLALLVLLITMQYLDLRASAEDHKLAAGRYSAMLATCMNGGSLYDASSNTAHFCSTAVSISNP